MSIISPYTDFLLSSSTTNQLSNYVMHSSRIGKSLTVSGWSDTSNGAFSLLNYNSSTSSFTGRDLVRLPGVRDVQVALMETDFHTYIVAAYYDNADSNYAFNLYSYFPGAVTLLYTYRFVDPHYPNLPASVYSTMVYNRISIDVSKDNKKIAFVMTDGRNSNMYTAVGKLQPTASGTDSIFFSPNLPHPALSLAYSSGPISPFPSWYDPAAVIYDTALGIWYYGPPYNPLMRLRSQSSLVTTPTYRPEYK